MQLTRKLLLVPAALLLGSAASAQSYTTIPDARYGSDISGDGEVVVGQAIDPANGQFVGYFWRWRIDPAPVFIGGKEATAVSADGSVIAGNLIDPVTGDEVAARWTQATGWVPLGSLGASCDSFNSSAYDISADGSTIVGLGWIGCDSYGFIWTQANGMQAMQLLGNKVNRASAISGDGATAVGFAQGSFDRTPATWNTGDLLGSVQDMSAIGEYLGINHDGSILLGTRAYRAFYEEDGVEVVLPSLNSGWAGNAMDVSESGGTIVGFDSPGFGGMAWMWNPVSGTMGLQSRLLSLGVVGVPPLDFATAVSEDGTVAVGHTFFADAWIVEIPPGPIATPYGCGLLNPPDSLTHVAGSSSIGGTLRLGVDDPTGSMVGPAVGVVSYAIQPDPNFPCGTPLPGFAMFGSTGELLISLSAPDPIMQQVAPALWTTAAQPVTVDFPIPFDTSLYGLDLYAQGALFSPSTMKIGLTNGMRISIGLD